tara:strand:+ start:1790 stop:1984 length:195 start_codon:yes stop_codon:yes gene_type:complete
MIHLRTDTDITENKITYWFASKGIPFGLRYIAGEESIVNHAGQTLNLMERSFIDQIRDAKRALK